MATTTARPRKAVASKAAPKTAAKASKALATDLVLTADHETKGTVRFAGQDANEVDWSIYVKRSALKGVDAEVGVTTVTLSLTVN